MNGLHLLDRFTVNDFECFAFFVGTTSGALDAEYQAIDYVVAQGYNVEHVTTPIALSVAGVAGFNVIVYGEVR